MSDRPLLPIVNTREQYRELFKINSMWEPAIKSICEIHKLDLNVVRSELGSHIVYKAGPYWIKLMIPMYETEMIYEVAGLKSVAGRLSVETPLIIGEGKIDGCPYIILTDVPGEPIKTAWRKLKNQDQIKIIKAMAQTMKELALCPTNELVEKRSNWNEFVTDQFLNCEEQQIKKQMPEAWLKCLKAFLKKFSLQEFTTDRPVFLHSDLTYDHFLIETNNEVKLSGIIDMADCQVGHVEYELAAPTVFVLRGNREGLQLLLKECGHQKLDQRFSEKLLVWCLIHRYFGFSNFFKADMELCQPGDFSALATRVFPL